MQKRLFFVCVAVGALVAFAAAQSLDDLFDSMDSSSQTQTSSGTTTQQTQARATGNFGQGTVEQRVQRLEEVVGEWQRLGEITRGDELEPKFVPGNDNEGIYPDISILSDPLNPFRNADYGSLQNQMWQAVNSANPERDFYLWATLNALGANGETQYYTALALKNGNLKDQAIRAFQAVLDYWPEQMSVNEEGYKWSLATAASEAIKSLGGQPKMKIRQPFAFQGGQYLGWMATTSYPTSNYDAWAIGQLHHLDLEIALHPAQEIHGIVSVAIEGSRPYDIIQFSGLSEDLITTTENHYGAYINKVDLTLDSRYVTAQIFKGLPSQNWDDLLDIHPKWWDTYEAQWRGWGIPAGFRVTEKIIPLNTGLMVEAGPAPNSIENPDVYYVRATPTIGPVTFMLARRQALVNILDSDNALVEYDNSIGATYLNGRIIDTIDARANVASMMIEAQASLDEKNNDMFMSNGVLLNTNIGNPGMAEFLSFGARVRYNDTTSRNAKVKLPLYGEMWFTHAGEWVYMGNKNEFGTDAYIGPFSYFTLHLYFLTRKNIAQCNYLEIGEATHPGRVFADNRECTKLNLSVTFDMTPKTIMRERWGNNNLTTWEDALAAIELGYRNENYPTYTDPLNRAWGYTEDAIYPEDNGTFGLYPCTLGGLFGAGVFNVFKWKFTLQGDVGSRQAKRGTEYAVTPWTVYQNYGFEANHRDKTIITLKVKMNDWLDYMYDPLPESWAEQWGVIAEQNIYIGIRQAVYTSYVELAYENIICKYVFEQRKPVHYISAKIILDF